MFARPPSWLCCVLALITLSACGDGPKDGPAPAPTSVRLELSPWPLTLRCEARDERIDDFAPDGSLLLRRDDGTLHVLTRGGREEELGVQSANAVNLLNESLLVHSHGDQLFVRDGDEDEEVRFPSELGTIQQVCGDPRLDGAFVVATNDIDGAVLTQRSGGLWWQWTPPEGDFGDELNIESVAGACSGDDDFVWATSSAGLFQMRFDQLYEHDAASELAFDPRVGVAARRDNELHFLSNMTEGEWPSTLFEAGDVSRLTGSAGHFWVLVAGRLHHYSNGTFHLATFDVALPGDVDALYPDASGGAWIESAGMLCRADHEGALHVAGIRPYAHTDADELTLEALETSDEMQVFLDGTMAHEGSGPATIPFTEAGWHSLEVRVGERSRIFAVNHVRADAPSFEPEIREIAETHCSGAACHGAERDDPTRIALVDYDDWVMNADAIFERVGVSADMPPTAARDEWRGDDAATVVAWIEGGMEESE